MIQQMLAIISGSSAFTETSLRIWKFTVLVLLKPGLENFEHYLLACEMSAIVQYFAHSLALPFFGIGMKTDLFQSYGHCWVFFSSNSKKKKKKKKSWNS